MCFSQFLVTGGAFSNVTTPVETTASSASSFPGNFTRKPKPAQRNVKFLRRNIKVVPDSRNTSRPIKQDSLNTIGFGKKKDHSIGVIGMKPPRVIRRKKITVVGDKSKTIQNLNISEPERSSNGFNDVATSEIQPNNTHMTGNTVIRNTVDKKNQRARYIMMISFRIYIFILNAKSLNRLLSSGLEQSLKSKETNLSRP